jgi:hypothetical protein
MTSHRIIKDMYSLGDFSPESYNRAEEITTHILETPIVNEIVSLDTIIIEQSNDKFFYGPNSL